MTYSYGKSKAVKLSMPAAVIRAIWLNGRLIYEAAK